MGERERDRRNSVLDGHRVGVDGLLPRHSLKPQKYASIVVLVALHDEATLFVTVSPCDANKVLLRLGERHQSPDTEADDSKPDCRTDAPMHVLPVADFRDSRNRHVRQVGVTLIQTYLFRLDVELGSRTRLRIRDGSSIVGDLIATLTRENRHWHEHAKNRN